MSFERLPLDILRSFVTFVDSTNMITAAERLRISQPLLTKHLQMIEREAGRPVFFLDGRKKRPTKHGLDLYRVVKVFLVRLEEDLRRLETDASEPSRAEVRIGGRRELLDAIPVDLTFPGRLIFHPLSGGDVLAALRERKIDIGITQHEFDSLGFVRKKWFEDRFHLIAPESWLSPRSGFATGLKKLASKPRLSYGPSDVVEELQWLFPEARVPAPSRVDPSWPRIVAMVKEEIGWAVVPELHLLAASRITSIPLPEEVKPAVTFHLLYPRELAKLEWFRELLNQLRS